MKVPGDPMPNQTADPGNNVRNRPGKTEYSTIAVKVQTCGADLAAGKGNNGYI